MKRAISCAAAAAIAVSMLGGCGKEKSSSDDSILNEASTGSKDYVFKIEDMGVDIDGNNISPVKIAGDKVYAVDYYGEDGKGVAVNSFNYDGSGLNTVYLPNSNGESYSRFNFDKDGNIYALLEIYHWEDDGEMHIMDEEESSNEASSENASAEGVSSQETSTYGSSADSSSDDDLDKMQGSYDYSTEMYDSSQEERYLVKYDARGNMLYKYDINKDLAEGDYLQIYGMVYSEKYGLLLNDGRGIEKFDENNGFTLVYDTSKSTEYKDSYLELYQGFNGNICHFNP
jgi:hypothetical protein